MCRFASPEAECQDELMANLAVGDYVLGRDGATRVIAVQHKANDIVSEMLTFHTDGRAVSMTADHGVFVDGPSNGHPNGGSNVSPHARLT